MLLLLLRHNFVYKEFGIHQKDNTTKYSRSIEIKQNAESNVFCIFVIPTVFYHEIFKIPSENLHHCGMFKHTTDFNLLVVECFSSKISD